MAPIGFRRLVRDGVGVNVNPSGTPVYLWVKYGPESDAITSLRLVREDEDVPDGFHKETKNLALGSTDHPEPLVLAWATGEENRRPLVYLCVDSAPPAVHGASLTSLARFLSFGAVVLALVLPTAHGACVACSSQRTKK